MKAEQHSTQLRRADPHPPLTRKVLLCLDSCHGEFYYPLKEDESPTCPVDARHDVAIYGDLIVRRYCDRCGDELGLVRAGFRFCAKCEGVDV